MSGLRTHDSNKSTVLLSEVRMTCTQRNVKENRVIKHHRQFIERVLGGWKVKADLCSWWAFKVSYDSSEPRCGRYSKPRE